MTSSYEKRSKTIDPEGRNEGNPAYRHSFIKRTMTMPIPTEQHNAWKNWLDQIKVDVRNLDRTHYMWSHLQNVLFDREEPDPPFFERWQKYFHDTYGTYAVATVRRQLRSHPDSISLAGLLAKTHAHHRAIDAQWWRDNVYSAESTSFWMSYFHPSRPHIDETHFTALEGKISEHRTLIDIGDRRMAHWDRRSPQAPSDMADITNALWTMHEILMLLNPLILGTPYAPDRSYESVNVSEAFTVPWTSAQ